MTGNNARGTVITSEFLMHSSGAMKTQRRALPSMFMNLPVTARFARKFLLAQILNFSNKPAGFKYRIRHSLQSFCAFRL